MITDKSSILGYLQVESVVSREPLVVLVRAYPTGLDRSLVVGAGFYVSEFQFRTLRLTVNRSSLTDKLGTGYEVEACLDNDDIRTRSRLFRALYTPETPQPDIDYGDTVQVLDVDSRYVGRIGKVESIYWTNARPDPRWLVGVRFRRGNFPLCRLRKFNATELEKLKD